MKLHVAKYEPNRIGGGWSFCRNLVKALGDEVSDYDTADVYFIPSPSMVQRDEVQKAKDDGKRIVLRVDNAVRNSRNRNTGMSRMYDFAQMADLVIYQSQWAKDYLYPFIKADGPVILNSVDTDVFYKSSTEYLDYQNKYLYSRFNRDETKNWEVARYWFSTQTPDHSQLTIVGQFSDELRSGNFDFYMGESYTYIGPVEENLMADLYRSHKYFIYTYYNDCCSNSLIEALVSGCKVVGDNYYRHTGGAPEIIKAFKEHGRQYFGLKRMGREYQEVIG